MNIENVKHIRDFLNLECSIFTITKKCFKKCLDMDFNKGKEKFRPNEIFQLSKNSITKQEYESFFLDCVDSCSQDFIISRSFNKEKLMAEADKVLEQNQKIYDGYYSDKT